MSCWRELLATLAGAVVAYSCLRQLDFVTSAAFCAGGFGLVAEAKGPHSLCAPIDMLLDFEVQRCTRRCAATDRALEPGDECFSVLEVAGADVIRKDFCREAWKGAPETAFGWWKSRVPEPTAKKIKLAPNDVLLELFDRLVDRSEQQDLRYVLALLLVRRRVLRVDLMNDQAQNDERDDQLSHAAQTMTLYCPKRETTHEVPVAMPSGERIDEIQQQLSELLVAGAE
jgi:hypothetical protein